MRSNDFSMYIIICVKDLLDRNLLRAGTFNVRSLHQDRSAALGKAMDCVNKMEIINMVCTLTIDICLYVHW